MVSEGVAVSYGGALYLLLPAVLVGVSDQELLGVGYLVLPCFQAISTHLQYFLLHSSLRRACRLRSTMESRLLPG